MIGSLKRALRMFDLGIRSAVLRFLSTEHARGNLVAPGELALIVSVRGLTLSVVNGVQAGVLMAMKRLDILGRTDLFSRGAAFCDSACT
jgi:hypothetical protein